MDKFPFFQPRPPFLERSLPVGWKSPWHDRDAWHEHPSLNPTYFKRDWVREVLLGVAFFGIYLMYDQWDKTYGPGSVEVKRLEEFMRQRNARLDQGQHHH